MIARFEREGLRKSQEAAAKKSTTGRSTPAKRTAAATAAKTTRSAGPTPKPREVSVGTDAAFASGSGGSRGGG